MQELRGREQVTIRRRTDKVGLKDILNRFKGKDKPDPSDDEDKPVVVNGYLQTSNTKVIRPLYSNTNEGRKERKS